MFLLSACAETPVFQITPTQTYITEGIDPQPNLTATIQNTDLLPIPTLTPVVEIDQDQSESQELTYDFSCIEVFCQYDWPGWMARPINFPDNAEIDLTYPYASTGGGSFDIHHGVEFPNPSGTPVHAPSAGEVVFAGSDDQIILGPYPNFYGNVIILHHGDLYNGEDVFSVYGHLSAILMDEKAIVDVGDILGEVGASGVAYGSHLHFEVRYGLNDYNQTTNPILWFAPLSTNRVEPTATLAGLIIDSYGDRLSEIQVTLQQLDEDGKPEKSYYFETYVDLGTIPHPALNENFALPDLPPGDYRLSVVLGTLYEVFFTLEAGKLGFINLQLD